MPGTLSQAIGIMIDYFLQIFSEVSLQMIPWIPGIIGIWLIIDLVSGLLFKEK